MARNVVVLGEKPQKHENFVKVIVQPQKPRRSLCKDRDGMAQGALDAGWQSLLCHAFKNGWRIR